MRKILPKKLTLHWETLHQLDAMELRRIQAGKNGKQQVPTFLPPCSETC